MHKMTTAEWIEFANAGTRTGKLGVVRANGTAHVSPIWFEVSADGSEVFFATGADTVKGKALRRDPRFTLCVDEQQPPYSFVQLTAEARLTDCGEELEATLPYAVRLGTRYMGAELGEQYGQRNNVPGELLVRGKITKVVALGEVAD